MIVAFYSLTLDILIHSTYNKGLYLLYLSDSIYQTGHYANKIFNKSANYDSKQGNVENFRYSKQGSVENMM